LIAYLYVHHVIFCLW